jgi:hypothetical protein
MSAGHKKTEKIIISHVQHRVDAPVITKHEEKEILG